MANVTVLADCVSGIPQVGTNTKSADPRTDTLVTITQVGTGHYYKGTVVDQLRISATQAVIDAHKAKGVLS